MPPSKKTKVELFLVRLNIPKHLCDHLISDKHTDAHRMSAGMLVMAVGESMVEHIPGIIIIGFVGHLVGTVIVAVGAMPFIERFEKFMVEKVEKEEKILEDGLKEKREEDVVV